MAGHATHVARVTGAVASGDEGGAAGAKISTGAPRALLTCTQSALNHHVEQSPAYATHQCLQVHSRDTTLYATSATVTVSEVGRVQLWPAQRRRCKEC